MYEEGFDKHALNMKSWFCIKLNLLSEYLLLRQWLPTAKQVN